MSRVDKIDILAIDRKICNSINDDDELHFHYGDTGHLIKEVGMPLPNLCIGCEEDLLEPYEVCEECGCSQGKVFLHGSSGNDPLVM